jgi:hypothetical protein
MSSEMLGLTQFFGRGPVAKRMRGSNSGKSLVESPLGR